MDILGLDRKDDSLSGTPHRVAKMYVQEIFRGLNPANRPVCSTFDNLYQYSEMLVERNITLNSTCEHHFLPVVGRAHVAYFSSGRVIGLSKLNRVVDHFGRRPQVQERLTRQICEALQLELNTEDVAVIIDAKHMCVSCRGIGDEASSTLTADYRGAFRKPETRQEFLQHTVGRVIPWPASEVCRLSLWGPRVWRAEAWPQSSPPAVARVAGASSLRRRCPQSLRTASRVLLSSNPYYSYSLSVKPVLS